MRILVTGAAGFVGFHLSLALIRENHYVVGVDNLNDYYDVGLKKLRLEEIERSENSSNFSFIRSDISDKEFIKDLFKNNNFDIVINLAAQAGVRYSLENPYSYLDSNMAGFLNILEGCRKASVKHLIYASSSSVYGMNIKQPFGVEDNVDHPVSFYAASKRSNELMAYSYSHLYKIPTTGIRFFTVYGPYGRPDMAYFKFTKDIQNNKPIDVFNDGKMQRVFTFIDVIVEGIINVFEKPPIEQKKINTNSTAPCTIVNMGNNNPVSLNYFIELIEKALNKNARKNFLPMQPGDVPITYADINPLVEDYNFKPTTSIEDGIKKFVLWFLKTYKAKD